MLTKKRIIFLIPTLMNGGAERVLLNLVNNLDFERFDVSLKTVMDVGRYQNLLDRRIHYSSIFTGFRRGCRFIFMLHSPEKCFQKYIGDNYDIVVSYLEGMTSRIMSGCTNPDVKKVAWIHIELLNNKTFAKGFRTSSEAKLCYSKFDNIICVSETVKKCFEKVSGITNRISVLYNTNNVRDIITRKNEFVNDIIFSKGICNICSVAKIQPSKGYDRLAHIHKRLLAEGIKNHIYILGTGTAQKSIQKYIDKNGLSDTFTFLGYRENPYKYISKCDLYVCSSRREGFSTAVTEALIVGLPIVSTRCSGAEELLGYHNEYGIVTDNDEDSLYYGIKEMITIEGNLLKYRRKALERGKQFSTKNTVRAVTEMLLE